MSRVNLCHLCGTNYTDFNQIYDENDYKNNLYQLIMNYFDPMLQSMERDDMLSSVCFECYQKIANFHSFKLRVYHVSPMLKRPNQNLASLRNNDSKDLTLWPSENPLREIALPEDYSVTHSNIDNIWNEADIFDTILPTEYDSIIPEELFPTLNDQPGNDITQDSMSEDSETTGDNDSNQSKDTTQANGQHQNVFPPKRLNNNRESDAFLQKWQPKLSCGLCNETCSTYTILRQHFQDQHPRKKFYVQCCQRKFFARYKFEDHIRLHIDPEAFHCKKCNKRYTQRKPLVAHYLYHHSQTDIEKRKKAESAQDNKNIIAQWRPIMECSECKEQYTNLWTLKFHFRKNHPENEFYIECCNRKFKKRCDIGDHARKHINPELLMCKICDCSFSSSSNITRHMQRVHSGLKKLSVRTLKRTQSEEFDRLVSQWKQNLECVKCLNTFCSIKMLRSHFKYAHPSQIFYIECCDQKLKVRHDIEMHARNHIGRSQLTQM